MATDLLTKVETEDGEFMVLTKTKYLAFFDVPRSSVMPYRTAKFVATPGFQVRYSTSDPAVLREWHEMLAALLRKGLFTFLLDGTRVGYFPYPDDKKHLEQYVKSFI
jgi:hypothetical protein